MKIEEYFFMEMTQRQTQNPKQMNHSIINLHMLPGSVYAWMLQFI